MRESVAPSSLAAGAYEFVKQRILRGDLAMGQVISRRKIAAELGMSFLPVSEALLRLEFEGLLESRPRAGTRVRIPSREDVRGHYVVREALEVQAAMLFAVVATAEDRAELQKLAARVDAMSVTEQSLYLPAHEKLHRRIAEGARCPALSAAIEKTHALASTWFCMARTPSDEHPERPHSDLADILVAGDRVKAAEAMREHVNRGMENTMRRLKPYFRIRRAYGKTFFRSEKRQKQQIINPSALN
ncbi:MAG TPA: GntR family transcriptional regulator [Terriglobia bacterium]|nr:GntR family transcriptional regulator [Terriglobia bacterium]